MASKKKKNAAKAGAAAAAPALPAPQGGMLALLPPADLLQDTPGQTKSASQKKAEKKEKEKQKRAANKAAKAAAKAAASSTTQTQTQTQTPTPSNNDCKLCGNYRHRTESCPFFPNERGDVAKSECKKCKVGLFHFQRYCPSTQEAKN